MSEFDKCIVLKFDSSQSGGIEVSAGGVKMHLPAMAGDDLGTNQPSVPTEALPAQGSTKPPKVTIYVSDDLSQRLDDVWHSLRRKTGIKFSRTDLGRAALDMLVADYERLGVDAPVIKRLLDS